MQPSQIPTPIPPINQDQQPIPPVEKKKFYKNLKIILPIIFILLAAIIAVLYIVLSKEPTAQSTKTDTSNQETTDPYSGWLTGDFESLKFSYKFPSDWKLKVSGSTKANNPDGYIEIHNLTSPESFKLNIELRSNFGYGYPDSEYTHVIVDVGKISPNDNKKNDFSHIISVSEGKSSKISTKSGIAKIGDDDWGPAYVSFNDHKDLLSANGGFQSKDGVYKEFTFSEFNSKDSVKEAKLILQSIKLAE